MSEGTRYLAHFMLLSQAISRKSSHVEQAWHKVEPGYKVNVGFTGFIYTHYVTVLTQLCCILL